MLSLRSVSALIGLFGLLGLAKAEPPAAPVGTFLEVAPAVPPGRVAPLPPDPLAQARARSAEGDAAGVLAVLVPALESKTLLRGRSRAAAQLLAGNAYEALGQHNLASAAYTQVRKNGGPLAPWALWAEARVDQARGRPAAGAQACASYRKTWPDGPHAEDCLMMMGDAWAEAGNRGGASAAYAEYLKLYPETPRKEEIRLGLALASARGTPAAGLPQLIELALDHSYPSTDLAVSKALGELKAKGLSTALPTDPTSQMRRADSLRRSGRFEEAWALFTALQALAPTNPAVAAWVEQGEDRFAKGTRNYDVWVASLQRQYEAKPSAETAWDLFKACGTSGLWTRALAVAHIAAEKHGNGGRFRSADEDIAWAATLAGTYPEAAERWGKLAKRGGDAGRKARFYQGFSALRGEDFDGALAAFDQLLVAPGSHEAAAHYWRAKARFAKGDMAGAAADQDAVRKTDDDGWYVQLLQAPPEPKPLRRHGRWSGPPAPTLAALDKVSVRATVPTDLWPADLSILNGAGGSRAALLAPTRPASAPAANTRALGWSALSARTPAPPRTGTPISLPSARLPIPDGYQPSPWYNPAQAAADFARFSEAHKAIWTYLPAANDLALAGLYTEAAIPLYDAMEEWYKVQREGPRGDARLAQIEALKLGLTDWRPLAYHVRDHHHAARGSYGLWKAAPNEQTARLAMRHAYPIVRGDEIWSNARRYNVDPLLVYGIMRQESTYQNRALSPVGAIGLIQVMPGTGARVAAMLGESRYSPQMLEEPVVNLRYGVYYLSKLLDRFDGAFPLAVAAYNGGPHNVSRWYKPWVGKIEMDAFVEQIQYDETRDYVKKVTGNYARYVELYEPDGADVVIPPRPSGDTASVIDF